MSDPSSGTRVPFSRRPPTRVLRGGALCVLLIGLGTTVWASNARPHMELTSVVAETYVAIERLQIVIWALIVAVAIASATAARTLQGVLLALWLGVAATLAALRELDLHVVLNPDNIHLLGLGHHDAVRFRLDWWTDSTVPGLLKISWAAVLSAIVALAVVPFVWARYPWLKLIRRRRLFPILIAAGFACLVSGFLLDDAIGRPLNDAGYELAVVEELVELFGAVLLLGATGLIAAGRLPTLGKAGKPVAE